MSMRLVIFVDSAPWELKSIVEFLNRSLETIDLFLVEARHFEVDGIRLVAPTLLGYTESVRRKRREAKARAVSAQGVLENPDGPADEESFTAAYAKKHDGQMPGAAAKILEFGRKRPFAIRWRIGQKRSALLTVPEIQSSNWFVLTEEGVLWPSFPSIPLKERASFAQRVCDLFAIRLPDDLDHKWPSIRESDWAPKVEPFLALTRELAEKLLAEKSVVAGGRER
jgi:hypothetical protein